MGNGAPGVRFDLDDVRKLAGKEWGDPGENSRPIIIGTFNHPIGRVSAYDFGHFGSMSPLPPNPFLLPNSQVLIRFYLRTKPGQKRGVLHRLLFVPPTTPTADTVTL